MSTEEPDVSVAITKFPFVMVIAATLLRGFIFAFLNGPLILIVLKGQRFVNIATLLNSGVISTWKIAVGMGEGLFSATLFIALCLTLGLLINPFELAASVFMSEIAGRVTVILTRNRSSVKFFSRLRYMNRNYHPLLGWLLKNPAEKLHWEWILFNYSLSWSLFTSISTWSILSLILISAPSIFAVCIYFALTILFLCFALSQSKHMAEVDNLYLQKLGKI